MFLEQFGSQYIKLPEFAEHICWLFLPNECTGKQEKELRGEKVGSKQYFSYKTYLFDIF